MSPDPFHNWHLQAAWRLGGPSTRGRVRGGRRRGRMCSLCHRAGPCVDVVPELRTPTRAILVPVRPCTDGGVQEPASSLRVLSHRGVTVCTAGCEGDWYGAAGVHGGDGQRRLREPERRETRIRRLLTGGGHRLARRPGGSGAGAWSPPWWPSIWPVVMAEPLAHPERHRQPRQPHGDLPAVVRPAGPGAPGDRPRPQVGDGADRLPMLPISVWFNLFRRPALRQVPAPAATSRWPRTTSTPTTLRPRPAPARAVAAAGADVMALEELKASRRL